MTRRRDEHEERQVEEPLGRLGSAVEPPSEHELRTIARTAAAEPRFLARKSRPRWPLRPRWAAVAVAVALLAGSGLGFGLGSSVTLTGGAGTNGVGTGFLPARGWNVVQSGAVSPSDAATAVAANVRLRPDDEPGDMPFATLESLPRGGVLILATFTSRGDPGDDARFSDAIRMPLEASSASLSSSTSDPFGLPPRVAQYRLRAAVDGYNVDIRIYYGATPPSARMVAAAQRQLNRLVVASERVTIFARPTVAEWGVPVTLGGSVDNGKAGEVVEIQAKECGASPPFFRAVASAQTREGGGWTTPSYLDTNTTLRAVWKDSASAQITVRTRVGVYLNKKRSTGAFEAWVVGGAQFWRKSILIQRRQQGAWKTVQSVVLTETGAQDPTCRGNSVWSKGTFTAFVPKGTLIRAVFPLSQARPCHLGGVSRSVHT